MNEILPGSPPPLSSEQWGYRVPWVWLSQRAWPLCVVGIVALNVLLWRPFFDAPLHVDTAGYAVGAYWWSRGDTLYYNLTITRPQGIFIIFRVIEALGLGTPRGIHLAATGWAIVCTVALLKIAVRVWGRRIGFGAAFIFSLLASTPILEAPTANAELFMLLPLLLNLALLLKSEGDSPGGRYNLTWLCLCGIFGAIALLVKPSGFVAMPLTMIWTARRGYYEAIPWQQQICMQAGIGIGFLLGLLPAIAHGFLTAPDRYLTAVLLYRAGQDSVMANPLDHQLRNALQTLVRLPILAVALTSAYLVKCDSDRYKRDLLWLWTTASFAGAALGGNWYAHYFLQLLPPLAVALAIIGYRFMKRANHLGEVVVHGVLLVTTGQVLITLLIVQTGAADPARLMVDTEPRSYTPATVSVPIVTYLQQHTTPDERIYVAYHQADLYYLSQRRPAARWLYIPELKLQAGAIQEQTAIIANEGSAPRYIVVVQPLDSFDLDPDGALRAIVARDYDLETTIGGIPLYRRK